MQVPEFQVAYREARRDAYLQSIAILEPSPLPYMYTERGLMG